MIEYRAGDLVEVTTGSAKTGNLRTLHGVVTGWTLRPIEGSDSRAFRLFTVETIEGTVTEAASRIALVRSAADLEREADEAAQDEMIRQGSELDARVERYSTANPVEIDDMPGGPMVYGRGRPFERARNV